MAAELLLGAPVADAVLDDVATRTARLRADHGVLPGLATVLVGDDAPSISYVARKHEACERVGMHSVNVRIDAGAGQQKLLDTVAELNGDPAIHGYIIQLPVPRGFNANEALLAMEPEKDADGLHPVNLGKLVLQEPGPVPCTPAGIQAMLRHYGIDIAGKEVCIVGRGPTLGRPLSLLLTLKQAGANAAVTIVHTGVNNIADYTRRADVVVAAVGVAGFVTADMVQPGAVVVGGGLSWEGKKMLSDVDEGVAEVASWVTPRLGGVGPTTVAMLLRNTVAAAERSVGVAP